MQLLQISENAKKLEGVVDAAVVMATSTNKELLDNLFLLDESGRSASESDLVIAVAVESENRAQGVVASIEKLLAYSEAKGQDYVYSIDAAFRNLPDANFAVVSVPGEYAAGVTRELLEKGVHVHLFSDHVALEDEIALKKLAASRGLLLLGPGAGTSLIGGKGIGFANVVRRGNVGIVAAAGTGLQELSSLLDQLGLGVSQALGVGGGDVKSAVGGLMTLQGLAALDADPETQVIVLVSKPPDEDVRKKIVDYVSNNIGKPVVANFVGADASDKPHPRLARVVEAKTVHAAALAAVKLASPSLFSEARKKLNLSAEEILKIAKAERLSSGQRFIRGFYTGGTLAYEALVLLRELCGDVWSNAPLEDRMKLSDSNKSVEHTVVDFGEEEFTAGRPHPMIDPTIRKLRLVEEARAPGVAVIMLDFVLGYGSNPDPAGAMLDSIHRAKTIARDAGRNLPILAHVCGTDRDPQNLQSQLSKLENLGVRVFSTNATMVLSAAAIANKPAITSQKLQAITRNYLDVQG